MNNNKEASYNDKTYSKKQIENFYQNIIKELGLVSEDISKKKAVNTQFRKFQENLLSAIDLKVNEAKDNLEEALNKTVWNKLVIAFFGETNAGKSTIIETFRILFENENSFEAGLIVGDGRSDFTKVYSEYELTIEKYPFILIDVPGIEGNESEFKEEIKTALNMAHYIFYVQGHNKKPDTATAKKIKHYLGDWVKVYSIYNVRGAVSNYDEVEDRGNLISDGIIKTENLIKSSFYEILGDVYAGNITLQALLAMSANAKFSSQRDDLIRGQKILLEDFGSSESILKFSQFQTLINLVKDKSKNFEKEIVESNKQKMISLVSRICDDIEDNINNQKESIEGLKIMLESFSKKSNVIMNKLKKNIKTKTDSKIEQLFGEFKSQLYQIIDSELERNHKNTEAEKVQNMIKNKLSNDIIRIINNEIKMASNQLNQAKKSLDGIFIRGISLPYMQMDDFNIDFTGAIDDLKTSLDDVASFTADAAGVAATGAAIGSFIPGFGTVAGAAVGAVIGGFSHYLTRSDKKAEVKKDISEALLKASSIVYDKKRELVVKYHKEIDINKNKIQISINSELQNIKDVHRSIDNIHNNLNTYINNLKNTSYGRI